MVVSLLVKFFLFCISFRFFFWLLLVEMLMLYLISVSCLFSSFKKKVFSCGLLILGACEVGFALAVLVSISRFQGIENIKKLKCEGF